MEHTSRYGLAKVGPDDHLSDESYKFGVADRDILDLLAYLGAEGHHHTGGAGASTAPDSGPLVSLVTTSGILPSGRRVYYRYTLIDATGTETAASPEVFIDTPAAVSAPDRPTLSFATTGGDLPPGNYYYVLSAWEGNSYQETAALNPQHVFVTGSLLTNTITVTFPELPFGADGFNIYRQTPNGPGYLFLASVDMTAATPPTTYIDDGSTSADPDRIRPTVNTTQSTNSVNIAVPTPLEDGQSWRIYRTFTAGDYTNSVLVTTEGSPYTDAGTATGYGQPPAQGVSVGNPSKVLLTDGAEVSGTLPMGLVAFPHVVTFRRAGNLATPVTGTERWVCEFPAATILACRAFLGVDCTPAATDVIVDVNKGTTGATPTFATIYTTQGNRPMVEVGDAIGARTQPDIRTLVAGDYLTMDLDQIGGGATPTDCDLGVNVYLIAHGYPTSTSYVPGATTGSGV
jgi:hypothetical protein